MNDELAKLSRDEIVFRMQQLQLMLESTEQDEVTPYPEFYRVLGHKIDYIMVQKRIKHTDLVKKAGIARSTLWRIVKGRPCQVHTLYLIAKALEVDICDLLPMSLEETVF